MLSFWPIALPCSRCVCYLGGRRWRHPFPAAVRFHECGVGVVIRNALRVCPQAEMEKAKKKIHETKKKTEAINETKLHHDDKFKSKHEVCVAGVVSLADS